MSEEIRIGVFICHCGTNIAGVIDVSGLAEYARGLKNVVMADEGKWTCSVDYLERIKELIREHRLNRLVVAACTPRTHEPLFKRTAKEAGLNPYLLEFVSIREQASWVHMRQPDLATQKAKDLVKMGVAKAALLEQGEEIRLPVKTDCMIIGGGIAGMTAALHVARQGFQAVIVEKDAELGGLLQRLFSVSHNHVVVQASRLVESTVSLVTSSPNIRVYKNAQIQKVEGYIGNYRVTVDTNGDGVSFDASTIIVATGMQEIEPADMFEYGRDPRVITQLQLEGLLKGWRDLTTPIRRVVMINCVGSRNEVRGCCNVGCHAAVKNALAVKELDPQADVTILYRDLSMVDRESAEVLKARRSGVKLIRFPEEKYPEVKREGDSISVSVYDPLLERELSLPADLLVLTVALVGNDSVEGIKGQLKVSSNQDGFLQEAHVKLGPVNFASDGLYLCGCARSPKNVKDSVDEAIGAAMRASIPMKRGYIEAEGIVADIDLTRCNQCGLCHKRCPYGAIRTDEQGNPQVIKALCKGCGLCAADCPKECITIVHYSDEQILAQVEAALEENPGDKIIGFVCHWCALGGVDMAGVSRLQYPPNARLIRVMCSARVSVKMIERAFELGAAGVLVAGCEFPTCHYISGNYAAETRIKRAKKILSRKGYDPERLWNIWCSAADGPKFAGTMREMTKALNLG